MCFSVTITGSASGYAIALRIVGTWTFESIPRRCAIRIVWIAIGIALALLLGGFLLNVLAWFAIPAAIIVGIALLVGWARRKPQP